MTITLSQAKFREVDGRDSMARASIWQGNAGSIYGLNVVYAAPTVATATVTSQVKTTTTVQYTVGGRLFSKANTDNFWTLAGTTVAISAFQKYLLCVDDAGAATVVEGTQAATAATVTWTNVSPQAKAFPQNPWAALISILNASRCIFGVLTVATDATHTFIPGTTLLGAAGITATYIDGLDSTLFPLLANERGLLAGKDF